MDVVQRLEPVVIEIERERECVCVCAHQAILRALYGYFTKTPLAVRTPELLYVGTQSAHAALLLGPAEPVLGPKQMNIWEITGSSLQGKIATWSAPLDACRPCAARACNFCRCQSKAASVGT